MGEAVRAVPCPVLDCEPVELLCFNLERLRKMLHRLVLSSAADFRERTTGT